MTASFSKLKVAIFYDWLTRWGGAEQVLLDLLKLFPQAELITTIYDPTKTSWLPKGHKIITTPLSHSSLEKFQGLLSPFYPIFLEKIDTRSYDLVISLSSVFGHCFLTQPQTKYIHYCLTPNRHLYQKNRFKFYQQIDQIFAQRPDYVLATSAEVAKRIKKYHHRDSQVIYPGVDSSFFKPNKNIKKQKQYLIVSRLVPYKNIDLAIQACGQLNRKLIVVGQGRLATYLKSLASNYKNIHFKSDVQPAELKKLYQQSVALLAPQIEDFGLAIVESQACGTPVISLAQGGALETVEHQQTGYLYPDSDINSLKEAILNFERLKLNSKIIRNNSLRFSKHIFMLKFRQYLNQCLKP